MPTYSQLVKHDAPTNLDDKQDFKGQVPHINMNYMLIWKKIEEVKKELGRDRLITHNIITGGPGALDHTLLANLDSINYHHVTQAQYNSLTGGVNSILHYHDTDRARANHTGTQLAATISDFQAAARLTLSGTAPITYNNLTGAIGITQTGITNLNSALTSGIVTITNGTGLLGSTPDNHVAWDAAAGASHARVHNILDSADHGDSLTGAVVDGDLIIGNVTPKWSRLAVSVPAANVRNVLGIDNAELRPSWKAALDGTLPETITVGGAGQAGTSLVFAHRDHNHPAPATWAATAHNLLSVTHGDTTAAACVVGDIIIGGAGPAWTKLADVAVGQILISGGIGVVPSWSATPYCSTLGLGVAVPSRILQLHDTGSGAVGMAVTNGTTGATVNDGAFFGIDSTEAAVMWQYENNHMYFGTNGTEQMRINATGTVNFVQSVGIGLAVGTAPASLLELYSASASPVLTITGAHATDYDPTIAFRTDAVPTVKAVMGVDSTDDSFHIDTGTVFGTKFAMNTTGGLGFGAAPLALDHFNIVDALHQTDARRNGIAMDMSMHHTANSAAYMNSFYLLAYEELDAGVVNTGTTYGSNITAYTSGAGAGWTKTSITGQYINTRQTGVGTLGELTGIRLKSQLYGGGVTTNLYDIYIENPAISGGATASNAWSIFNNNVNLSYFSGPISINTSVLTASKIKLEVKPAAAGGGILIGGSTVDCGQYWYCTNANAGTRNWYIGTNYNNWGDIVFRYSTARLGDPYAAGVTALEITNDGIVRVRGTEAGNGTLYLMADEGDDISDIFAVYNKYNATSANNLLVIANDNAVKGTLVDLISITTTGIMSLESTLKIKEAAAAPADTAAYGQWWVRNDTPCAPMFTDDAGNDFEILGCSAVTTETVTADRTLTVRYAGHVYKLDALYVS